MMRRRRESAVDVGGGGYGEFLLSKARVIVPAAEDGGGCCCEGESPSVVLDRVVPAVVAEGRAALFDFQRRAVLRALELRRCGMFFATGMGKTRMLLAYCQYVLHRYKDAGARVLVLTPLCTANQVVQEAERMGVPMMPTVLRKDRREVKFVVTNYEMLEHFDLSGMTAVVLDESSILKHGGGCKTAMRINQQCQGVPYKLSLSATPCPNDMSELLQQAAFLQVDTFQNLLANFFVQGSSSKPQLRTHAVVPFCRWLLTWSVWATCPSDLGCDHERKLFELPELHMHEVTAQLSVVSTGGEKAEKGGGGGGLLQARESTPGVYARKARAARQTLNARVSAVCEVVNAMSDRQWLVWAWLNDESKELVRGLRNSAEICGTDPFSKKVRLLDDFVCGRLRVLVSKPDIVGFGLNLQHVSHMAFVALNDSYEKIHQAIRRCWRFGQTRSVHVYVVKVPEMQDVQDNLRGKSETVDKLLSCVKAQMKAAYSRVGVGGEPWTLFLPPITPHTTTSGGMVNGRGQKAVQTPAWTLLLGDCVLLLANQVLDESVDYVITSPPFQALYAYTDLVEDISNVRDTHTFERHMTFCAAQLFRVLRPGRFATLHCMNVPRTKMNYGDTSVMDLRRLLVRVFESVGFLFHDEVVVFRDPVIAMIRTKAHGLFHKTFLNNASYSRQALCDYLITLRKPGGGGREGSSCAHAHDGNGTTVSVWHIDHNDTLNISKLLQPCKKEESQHGDNTPPEDDDRLGLEKSACIRGEAEPQRQRHPTCLQLPLIRRSLDRWTAPGDLVLDPFSGIASVGVVALSKQRRYLGIELKPQYYNAGNQALHGAAAAVARAGEL